MTAFRTLAAVLLLASLACATPASATTEPQVPGLDGQDVAAEPIDCVKTLIDSNAWCDAANVGCTSTSRCTGAAVDQGSKMKRCISVPPLVGACTPWIPVCMTVTVWYADEMETPTVDLPVCLPVPSEDVELASLAAPDLGGDAPALGALLG